MAQAQTQKNSKPNNTAKPAQKGSLQFAPSTFGQRREQAPITEDRLQALRELHASMVKGDVYPSKTAFVVAAHKAGYTTREIAEVLSMKPAVVYSMIWRVTHNYKPSRKAKDAKQNAAAPEADEAGDLGDEDISDEDLDAADDELADDDI